MKSQAGNDFDAKVQISAERRGIEYIFENVQGVQTVRNSAA